MSEECFGLRGRAHTRGQLYSMYMGMDGRVAEYRCAVLCRGFPSVLDAANVWDCLQLAGYDAFRVHYGPASGKCGS